MSTQETNSTPAVLTSTNSCHKSSISTEEGDNECDGNIRTVVTSDFSPKCLIPMEEKVVPKKKTVNIAMTLTVVFIESYKKYNRITGCPKLKRNQKTEDPECHCNCSLF